MAQRVVIVVALGVALIVIGLFVSHLRTPASGWHLSSPVNAKMLMLRPRVRVPAWFRAIVWLVLTGIWAAASVTVLRTRQGSSGPQ